MIVKKVIKGVKDMGSMYKGFYDAFKTRKEDYNKYVGKTGKKK